MSMSTLNKRLQRAALAVATLLLSACSTVDTYRSEFPEPGERLDHILALFELNRVDGIECNDMRVPERETGDCGRLLSELDRLMTEFPSHSRILMANAVYQYKAERKDRAQLALDQLLSQSRAQPDAAILRARIALEEGNTVFAQQLLMRQISLAPERVDLRSALASVHFASGQYQKARNLLNLVQGSSAARWEVSYHFGLIAEGEKDWSSACTHYQTALLEKSNYGPAMSRLVGLAEHLPCPHPRPD